MTLPFPQTVAAPAPIAYLSPLQNCPQEHLSQDPDCLVVTHKPAILSSETDVSGPYHKAALNEAGQEAQRGVLQARRQCPKFKAWDVPH